MRFIARAILAWFHASIFLACALTGCGGGGSGGPAPTQITQVTVPNVVGMTQVQAVGSLTGDGLAGGTVTTANSATVPSGSVISQDPAAGTSVKPGSSVNLTVSSGPASTLVTVPNVEGMTQSAATAALINVGLIAGTITAASSATVAAGSVINQSPPSGTEVAAGSAVDLTVSSGPASSQVAVPNLVGLTQAAATAAITGAGLVLGSVTMASSPTVPAGNVISQSPAAATQVAAQSAVNITVSSGTGSTAVSVPSVVGLTQAAASSAITAAGLTLGSITNQSSATVASGVVISESPAAGSSATSGSSVSLVVSSGPATVSVPNVVGMTQSAASSAITSASLTLGAVTTQSSTTVALGLVISENPVSGSKVSAGSSVSLFVSSGSATTVVPSVAGLTQANAVVAIVNAGLVTGSVSFASSSTIPVGNVVGESPVAGTTVARGSAVNLSVSTGPPQVTVPNVVGLTQAAATTAITGAGLILGGVATSFSTTIASGSVISESPAASAAVAPGSAVSLTVSSGGGLSALPGDPSSPASSALTDQVLDLLVPSEVIDTDPDFGSIARNRILIHIAATTTIGQVNVAVASINGQIITMLEGYSGIEIIFPDPGTVANLQKIIALIEATPGVVSAHEVIVGTSLEPNALPSNDPLPMDDKLADLAAARATAVWNTSGLLIGRGLVSPASGNVAFVEIDKFGLGGPGANISASLDSQYAPAPTGGQSPQHGYSVLSRALFDFGGGTSTTTMRPLGAALPPFPITNPILFRAIDLLGTGQPSLSSALAKAIMAIKSAPGKVVLNASLGSCKAIPTATFNFFPGYCNTAPNVHAVNVSALEWLQALRKDILGPGQVLSVGALEQKFIVTTSAGNDSMGLALNNNTWAAAALQRVVDPVSGQVVAPAPNVLVVESNAVQPYKDSSTGIVNGSPVPGCRSTWPRFGTSVGSSVGGNIAAFGEGVPTQGVLVATDGSTGAEQKGSDVGTSFAAPQVAGLVLYLWRVDDTQPAASLVRSILANAVLPGSCAGGASNSVIDAFATVLELDAGTTLSSARVRTALLDVTDVAGSGSPDGQFTYADFLAFLTEFATAQTSGTPQPDFSRYDLNGDGFTGGTHTARFNLSAQYTPNGMPVYGTVSQLIAGQSVQFNENNLTDLQVLCYYAYSSLMSLADQADIPMALASVNQKYGTTFTCTPFVLDPQSVSVSLNLTDLGDGVGSIVSGPGSVSQSCAASCGVTASGGSFNSTAVVTDVWTQYRAPNITFSSSLQGNVTFTTSSNPIFNATANWSDTAGPFEGTFSGTFNVTLSQPYTVFVTPTCTGSVGAVAIPCGGIFPSVKIISIQGPLVQNPALNQYILGAGGTYAFSWGLVGGAGASCCIGAPDDGSGPTAIAMLSLNASFQPIVTIGPAVTLTANPASVTAGNSSALTWSSQNAVSCSAPWTTSRANAGTASTGALTADTTYSMTCTDSSGITSAPVSVTVPVTRVFNGTFTYNGTIIGGSGSVQLGSGSFTYDTTTGILSAFSLAITNQSSTNPNIFNYSLADVTANSFSYNQVTGALNFTTDAVAGTNSIYFPQLFTVTTVYGSNVGTTATQDFPGVPETSGSVTVTTN